MEQKKQEGAERFLRAVVTGTGVALVASLGLLCLAAAVCVKLELGTEIPVLAVCVLSGLIGGATAARVGKSRRLPVALAAALVWFLVWLVIGAAGEGSIDSLEGLRHLAAALAGGFFGGVLASRPKKSRK